MNPSTSVAEVASATLVTTTLTAPRACAGVVAVIWVVPVTVMPVASSPPKVTLASEAKCVPVMVTVVPPAIGPRVGSTVVIVGRYTQASKLGLLV